MEKVIIQKNKGETFRCQLKINGADIDQTDVRLCLELDENRNLYFKGTLDKEGNCSFTLPRIKEDCKSGKMMIEAIADGMYFRLYEANVELKNSVEISMNESSSFLKQDSVKEADIKLETIQKEETPVQEKNPFIPKSFKKPVKTESKFQEYLKHNK